MADEMITEGTEEFIVEVPYCKTCEKVDMEALKHPKSCCGDKYFNHAVKEDGTISHDEEYIVDMLYEDKQGISRSKPGYHEFETERVRVKGTILGLAEKKSP